MTSGQSIKYLLTEIDKLLDGQRRRIELGVKVQELFWLHRSCCWCLAEGLVLGRSRSHLGGRVPESPSEPHRINLCRLLMLGITTTHFDWSRTTRRFTHYSLRWHWEGGWHCDRRRCSALFHYELITARYSTSHTRANVQMSLTKTLDPRCNRRGDCVGQHQR